MTFYLKGIASNFRLRWYHLKYEKSRKKKFFLIPYIKPYLIWIRLGIPNVNKMMYNNIFFFLDKDKIFFFK